MILHVSFKICEWVLLFEQLQVANIACDAEVPPGFDQATEGLTVPWESVSGTGLAISEAQSCGV